MPVPAHPSERPAFSLLELLLILGIAALAIATILPSVNKTRDAIVIERAARCLDKSKVAATFLLEHIPAFTNSASITLADIDSAFAHTNLSNRLSPPHWPPEIIRESFNPQGDGAPTIDVRLGEKVVTVSADDIAAPQ